MQSRAYQEGKIYYRSGFAANENPYRGREGREDEKKEWDRGYADAKAEAKKAGTK